MTKQNKIILGFLMFIALLVSSFFIINYIKSNNKPPLPPSVINNTDPEPQLGYFTRNDIIKHVEWAYRNGKSYKQVALTENGPKDYVVTFYQPNYRGEASDPGGIIVFQVKNNQPKIIWESTEDISLTLPTDFDVRDITGDKNVEIITVWSDGKVSILYLYSWDGETFRYITPLKKSESKYAPPNSYSPIFGTNRGDIQVKDMDRDNIEEVIISGGIAFDEIGNEIPIERETIYKWDTQKQEYYLWKQK